ncbi:deoxyuridine triphosphatase [Equid alphaherpesvirus 1]|uniref:Deoxyuridine triphosphatase n=1 Tax=Equid alphaherpesvirus 1 TaxID=10326 RepID=A0A0A7D855_9ALPH|nr:deoxyuridine triphosphatase [Equid alphaherpesvirus 1]APQ37637.1 deoxyuridine triphosphatase [Equid alphaherpesvirus 1]
MASVTNLVDSIVVVECGERWRARAEAAGRLLVLINNHTVELSGEHGSAGEFYSVLTDVGVRVACSSGYAIVLTQISGLLPVEPEPGNFSNVTFPENSAKYYTAYGIVDSGYRGVVKAVQFAPGINTSVPPGQMSLGLVLVKLARKSIHVTSIGSTRDGRTSEANLFYDYFAPKRVEDAGYDISAPEDATIDPDESHFVDLLIVFANSNPAVTPCIFGRSSMNRRGLIVLPTRWVAGRTCCFFILNVNKYPVSITKGQRVAQLLLTEDIDDALIPPTVNYDNPFPTYSPSESTKAPQSPVLWKFTTDFDREAPSSLRADGGFGSTGL